MFGIFLAVALFLTYLRKVFVLYRLTLQSHGFFHIAL